MTLQRSAAASGAMDPVMRRLSALAPVGEELARRLELLGRRVETVSMRTVLQSEGEPLLRARFILSGWAFRQRLLPDGRRQIFSVLLPGDAIGVTVQPRPLDATTTIAITRMTTVDASELLTPGALTACPELLANLNGAANYEASLLLDHVVRLGRQTAYERVAHLLLELNDRLCVVGLGQDGVFDAPLTQEIMADALGLSVVHINRTLQQLRREHMIVFEGGRVTLLAPDRLAAAADYIRPKIGCA